MNKMHCTLARIRCKSGKEVWTYHTWDKPVISIEDLELAVERLEGVCESFWVEKYAVHEDAWLTIEEIAELEGKLDGQNTTDQRSV